LKRFVNLPWLEVSSPWMKNSSLKTARNWPAPDSGDRNSMPDPDFAGMADCDVTNCGTAVIESRNDGGFGEASNGRAV
jgi:hypothetical protein